MNSRSLPEHNSEIMMTPGSYSKGLDFVKLVKATPSTRLEHFDKVSMYDSHESTKVMVRTGDKQKKRKRRRKKKWTKPMGKPKRPLSAYNIFFANERVLMLGQDIPTPEQEALKKKVHCKTHGKISFAVMARTIGARWKALGSNEKKTFEDKAQKVKEKYLIELDAWKEKQKEESLVAKSFGYKEVEDVSNVATRKVPVNSEFTRLRSDETVVPTSVLDLNAELRLILQYENRHRYLSLLQSNPLTDYIRANQNGYFPQIDQSLLHGLSRRVAVPTLSGLIVERDLQWFQNVSSTEYNNQYLQTLEDYATMLRFRQRKIMMGYGMGKSNRTNGL